MATNKVLSKGRWYLNSLLLSCAFLLTFSAHAALQFDAFLGYDGIVPARGWFPIVCEVNNDGPSFNARIQVSSDSGQTREVELELPTNTRKRICIPVFTTSRLRYWDVKLLDEHGKSHAEQTNLKPRRIMPASIPMIGAMARTVGGVPSLPELSSRSQDMQPIAARMQPEIFPDNPLALEGLETIYLSSEKALDLSIAQFKALTAWLERGGHLVVSVEQSADLNGAPWLKELLPAQFSGTASVKNHEDMVEWTRQRDFSNLAEPTTSAPKKKSKKNKPADDTATAHGAEIKDDPEFDATPISVVTGKLKSGHVVIGEESAPLVIESHRVRGTITVLTFSPEREPFISWKNRGWFWAKMAGIPFTVFESRDFKADNASLSSDGIFGGMIDSRQIRKLPLGWLLLLLVAYLVVIGPLDQYWLKKINKQMWTWVTFPIYVVVFSLLIYLIGFHLRAGELEWNELSVVDILPGGDGAVWRGQTYVSIYSPSNSRYQMSSDQPFATLRGEFQGSMGGGGAESSRVSVRQRGNSFVAEAFVPVWTSQLYVSDWLQSGPQLMTMKAVNENGTWKVTVQNNTDHPLTHAHAVLNRRVFDLGDLPANQTKTFSLEATKGQTLAQFAGYFADTFRNAAQSRRQSFGNNNGRIDDLAGASMGVSFLSQANRGGENWDDFVVPASLDLTRFSGAGQGILLAWDAGRSETSSFNQFKPRRLQRNSLLRLVTPVENE